ncbi:cytochrome c oxidase assembly protein subunit 15 [Thermoactinomyces sp. DSM 45891]|uniref:COX15/CtaA family protein n=1 Tax=Thermoactinomyces sp. DSM 45891 TaxID=1761907 RepID=UPI00091D0FD0|nr:heme A synthase [Thermoactinomyces sp. DSM 45891]SFX02669.1 cytochrome c oxidase assembly protein subunit 15 [Thermoactinomyces sp. DSM 45891]
MKKHATLRFLSIITALVSYFMLLMGAIVTKTGSGKGCGNSWPICKGELIPESMPLESIIEYSHRIISSGAGMLILALTIWSWMVYRDNFRVKLFGAMSVFFVLLQGGLGALTVMFEGPFIKKFMLALHFGFSLISFASVMLLVIQLYRLRDGKPDKCSGTPLSRGFGWSVWGLATYTYIAVYSGALVRHMEATMGCGYDFPSCGVTKFPGFGSTAEIHMLHRYAGILLFLLTLWLLVVVLRKYRDNRDFVRGSWIAMILITLQAIAGIITVKTGGVLMAALLHTTIITIYFTAISYLCMLAGAPWKKRR